MVELVDTQVSEACAARHESSSLSFRTILKKEKVVRLVVSERSESNQSLLLHLFDNNAMPRRCIPVKAVAALLLLAALGGCARARTHEGEFFSVKLPQGWELTPEAEKVITPFYAVSEEKVLLATYASPERSPVTGKPLATMSIYVQKFNRPLWAEDMGFELETWLTNQGYTILGQGKLFHKKAIGYSINYRNDFTNKVYLDFYYTTDHMMYMVMSGVTDADLFTMFLYDFETFRQNIQFSLMSFYL